MKKKESGPTTRARVTDSKWAVSSRSRTPHALRKASRRFYWPSGGNVVRTSWPSHRWLNPERRVEAYRATTAPISWGAWWLDKLLPTFCRPLEGLEKDLRIESMIEATSGQRFAPEVFDLKFCVFWPETLLFGHIFCVLRGSIAQIIVCLNFLTCAGRFLFGWAFFKEDVQHMNVIRWTNPT
jgi:hypothetical protein